MSSDDNLDIFHRPPRIVHLAVQSSRLITLHETNPHLRLPTACVCRSARLSLAVRQTNRVDPPTLTVPACQTRGVGPSTLSVSVADTGSGRLGRRAL